MSRERFPILLDYCLGLLDPLSNTDRLERARPLFDDTHPQEVFDLVDAIVSQTPSVDDAKTIVTRALHSFSKTLNQQKRPFERGIPYIEEILQRNDKIEKILESLKRSVSVINETGDISSLTKRVQSNVDELITLTDHYSSKENVLFPLVEQSITESNCISIMWAIHDDIRFTLKSLAQKLEEKEEHLGTLNRLFGKLFFDLYTMIFREEQILFPVMIERISHDKLLSLGEDEHQEGQVDPSLAQVGKNGIDLITGNPTAFQLIQLFNALPVDITLVDADDKVVYFNTPVHRVFPRAKSVIGRSVQNCHPPTSLHIVNDIVEAFKTKKRSEADFRIYIKGRLILIRYIALYDHNGTYSGTMEVSQDITDLQSLEGEKRLLTWSSD
ncbi:MAG: PAS domain-containing protein [Sphaerochaetaceae bacterium]|jgi:DUF438 domain-containing protein